MRKLAIATGLFIILGLSSSFAQEVQSGTFAANVNTAGYSLDKGSGDRTHTIEVSFPTGFDTKPSVILSVSTIDADKGSNLRYEVVAKSISRDGFIITIRTWADSKIHGIGGSWLAVAAKK